MYFVFMRYCRSKSTRVQGHWKRHWANVVARRCSTKYLKYLKKKKKKKKKKKLMGKFLRQKSFLNNFTKKGLLRKVFPWILGNFSGQPLYWKFGNDCFWACSKWTIQSPEEHRWYHSEIFTVNFKQILSIAPVSKILTLNIPTGINLFKVRNKNTRTRCEIYSKLTIKTPGRRHWRRFCVFTVNFEHISHLILVFLL